MLKKFIFLFSSLLLAVTSMGQNANLIMHFDFDQVSGNEVTDRVAGVKATLQNEATVVTAGDYHLLNLGNGTGYLDMGRSAGELVRQLTDFTVSAYYRVESAASLTGAGYFLWCFSQSAANTQTSSPYAAYRLNVQRMAISSGGWGSETGFEVGTESAKGRWVHMAYRQTGAKGELFLDGKLAGQATNMPTLKSSFTAAPAYNWIGRAPFSGDNYLKQTLVADFRLYGAALSDAEVAQLNAAKQDLDYAYKYGTPGDFTELQALLQECQSFVASATEGYAPNAVAELEDQMRVVDRELKNARASQPLIDEFVATLRALLAQAQGSQGYQPKRVFEHTSDHGFVHPGGLVSQADIDRAKQMLADGNERMKRAWDILCANGYSHADVATWPTPTVIRGGGSGQNYMNCARGAAMAFQNALRWKIAGTRDNADAAVRIMMQWARECNGLGGDTNISLAAGIYGHEFANAAELMRDYDGWSAEDFAEFKQWMIRVFYNPAIDFLRRRHDTWLNWRNPSLGERPGHYWSNWGLCNALCVMSIGILCDDVHMYNQGVSFYKYDHVGTFKDRAYDDVILNDGCNEFIGNLVPVVLPDERGPLGYLGQMQESGRDQGHTLMALGLAVDICQIGFNQGDDLFAFKSDRIAAGAEFVAAMNFGGVEATSLPWINYNYADCRGRMGQGWHMTGPNTGGSGEFRPYWDRLLGYYEGLRGVPMQYTEKASAAVCPDGGGGNYSQNSGGFDHLGFSTLTSWRPLIDQADAITPLRGNIKYKGMTYYEQTNLGGLKYNYEAGPSKGIPADGADIVLQPVLPRGITDTGKWQWSTGETTREITVKADRSYIYRVTYTAENGQQSHQSFAIAVSGDADPDVMTNEITVDGVIERTTEKTVLSGTSVILYAGATTGWTDDYLWDNGVKNSVVVIPAITSSRSYTCQYANQSGAVSESRFQLNVVPAMQFINGTQTSEAQMLAGSKATLTLTVPTFASTTDITWQDGSHGDTFIVENLQEDTDITATFDGDTYTYHIALKTGTYGYYSLLSAEKGFQLVTSTAELTALAADHYFVLASDDADLLIGLKDAPHNGNKALFFETPVEPLESADKVFTVEPFDGGFCLRNIDYDGLLLQTEMNRPDQLRTHDQPLACSWARFLLQYDGSAWTVENGTYTGNWLGLWTPANGYRDGEEIACNKKGDEIAHLQLFAIDKQRFHTDYLQGATVEHPKDATVLVANPDFVGNGAGWTMTGTWGNQRYNGSVEVWHSTNFDFSQSLSGLPDGWYNLTCQMVNGEGKNTGYVYATSGANTAQAVVKQNCAGSTFDAERDKMSANAQYAQLSVDIQVEGGTLTYGIKEPSSDTTWLVWDNFRLTYANNGSLGIGTLVDDAAKKVVRGTYDLQGRRLTVDQPTRKGIYIINGRKVVIK